jgi:recombination protein RecA
MAKKKAAAASGLDIDAEYASIAEETGGDILDDIADVKFFIDTGNLAINYSCSGRYIKGGIPGNKITEVFGPEASGKSLIASNCLFGVQQFDGWAIILDCENATNGQFMEKISHLNLKRVLRYAPSSLERAFRQIHTTTKSIRDRETKLGLERKPILFVFDSLTVPPCERELRENDLPMDYSPAEWKTIVGRQEQPGERARIISAEMRKLQAMVVQQDVTVYLVNQTRDKIGVMYGSPETTPGGNAVKFYSSLRMRTQAKKKIEHKSLEENFSGVNMQIKNVKNRSCRPFIVADDIKLYFEEGVDPLSGLLKCLISDQRITGKGNYSVAQAYLPEGRAEYKFRAKKSENRISSQVLLDCPKLIDAESEAEVQEYLDRWGSGMLATESGDYAEKIVQFDADGNPFETGEYVDYKEDEDGDED